MPIVFVGCRQSPPMSAPLSVSADTTLCVQFDRFIQCGYAGRHTLRGFLTTDAAIAAFLRQGYARYRDAQQYVDAPPTQAAEFFAALPDAADCDVSIVYLAASQTADGLWEFADGSRRPLEEFVALAPPHPFRIAIIDACYAGRFCASPLWRRTFAMTLAAAQTDELTYEFRPVAFDPIDVSQRFPAAWGWANAHLAKDWQERISFLGLMWLNAAAHTAAAPTTAAEWRAYLRRCVDSAQDYRRHVGHRYHSTVGLCP